MTPIVAVTGATGFVGRHVVDALLAKGFRVRALVRAQDALECRPNLDLVVGRLDDQGALAALVAECDLVLHLAARLKGRRALDFHAVNVEGTASLLRAAQGRARPPRFILLSSLAAREPQLSDYAASKRAAEDLLAAAGEEVEWQILRAPAVYGPGDRATLPFFQQMRHGFLAAPGDPEARFSLVQVEDLAQGLVAMATTALAPGLICSLQDSKLDGYRWSDLAQCGHRVFKRPIRVVAMPRILLSLFAAISYTVAGVLRRDSMLSHGKVREIMHPDWVSRSPSLSDVTDWRPQVTLEEGFAQTIDWYRARNWLK